MFRVEDDSPPGVSQRGLCFITQRTLGEVDETLPGGGTQRRRERVVVTPRMFVFGDPPPPPGLVAVNESTVWQMGRLVGMVPASEVEEARAHAGREAARRESAENEVAALKAEVAALRARLDAGVRL